MRIILSVALYYGWCIRQLDVNNAFLNGELEEPIYMRQSPSFEDVAHPHKVSLFKKALYGLKQALQPWFHKLQQWLLAWGFIGTRIQVYLFVGLVEM